MSTCPRQRTFSSQTTPSPRPSNQKPLAVYRTPAQTRPHSIACIPLESPRLLHGQTIGPKKLRKLCLKHKSFKNGSTSIHEATIVSATYHQSKGKESIQIETRGDPSLIQDTLYLVSTPASNNPILKSFRRIMPSIVLQSGHFVVGAIEGHGELPCQDDQHYRAKPLVYRVPLPFDKLVLLTSKISSRRSRRTLNPSQVDSRFWFIRAIWQGMQRLGGLQQGTADGRARRQGVGEPDTALALVNNVMDNFEYSWRKFHHKIMRLQQKSDRDMSITRARGTSIRQEVDSRNQEMGERLKSSREMSEANARLEQRAVALQQRLDRFGGQAVGFNSPNRMS